MQIHEAPSVCPDCGGDRVYNASTTRLTKLRDGGVVEFLNTYEMGDNWEHHIEVLDLLDAPTGSRLPFLLDGRSRAPPEDIDGVPGFEIFLEAINGPNHEDHDDLVEWYGRSFDHGDIEPDIVNIQVARLALLDATVQDWVGPAA